MKFITKRFISLCVFSFSTLLTTSAFSSPGDTAILSSNLQTLKNIEKNIEKNHNEDMIKKNDTLAILHNDMLQMNTYLMDIDILLNRILDNQKEGLQKNNKPVAMLNTKEKNEENKSLNKIEEETVK
ncbi:MAG: hypothetical protein K2X69_05165 [Silvanigrellaceae bacterium]|nr:hypothetical protein [Silvanigrellaceae bacterium]